MRHSISYSRGSHSYEMRQLGGKLAARLSTVVLNAVADVAPALVSAAKGGLGNLDIGKLKLDWDKVEPLLDAFAAHTFLVRGAGKIPLDAEVFDEHFAGDLDGMLELVLKGLELNYSSFLEQRFGVTREKIQEAWERATKSAESASQFPTDSTGTTGE